MSLSIARKGTGDPCPDCGATATIAVPAVAAHRRCMLCGNAWEEGEVPDAPPRPDEVGRHTPGPWRRCPSMFPGTLFIKGPDSTKAHPQDPNLVAIVARRPESEANLSLIAAAPGLLVEIGRMRTLAGELLAACEAATSDLREAIKYRHPWETYGYRRVANNLDAAAAKARATLETGEAAHGTPDA